jgi:hypothetical protein
VTDEDIDDLYDDEFNLETFTEMADSVAEVVTENDIDLTELAETLSDDEESADLEAISEILF